MTHQTIVGIDIGTSEIKAVIAKSVIEHGRAVAKIIGTGSSEAKGVYRGYVTNQAETARSIETAIGQAEKTAGIKIKRAYVSFGGIGLGSVIANGSVIITRADLEITDKDLSLVLEVAESSISPNTLINRKIINTIPIEYKIDGEVVWGQALGLKGQKLEVRALFLTCLEHHIASLIKAVEEAGIEVIDVVASPVAVSFVTLSKKQKRAGCILADIGAETTSIVVFENNNLLSLEVFPVGGNDITNDLALGLKVSPEVAENIKIGKERVVVFSKKKVDDIVSTRLKDIFTRIETHLKSINRNALLPAGIIIAGGSSNINGIKEIAESSLKLPSQLAEVYFGDNTAGKLKDRTWAVACGLAIVGFNADDNQQSIGIQSSSLIAESGKRWGRVVSRWISQFLP